MPKSYDGCKVCRVRKKPCDGPEYGNFGSCGTCNRLNIDCLEGYGQHIEPEYRHATVIAGMKAWNSVRANRVKPDKFSLDEKVRELREQASGVPVPEAEDLAPNEQLEEEHQISGSELEIVVAHDHPQFTIEGQNMLFPAASHDMCMYVWSLDSPIHGDAAPPSVDFPFDCPQSNENHLYMSRNNVTFHPADNQNPMAHFTSNHPTTPPPVPHSVSTAPCAVTAVNLPGGITMQDMTGATRAPGNLDSHPWRYGSASIAPDYPAQDFAGSDRSGPGNQRYDTSAGPTIEALFDNEDAIIGESSVEYRWD